MFSSSVPNWNVDCPWRIATSFRHPPPDILQQIEFYLSITDDIPRNREPDTRDEGQSRREFNNCLCLLVGGDIFLLPPEWQSPHDSFALLFVQCTAHSIVHKVVLLVVFHLNCLSPLSVDWEEKGVTGERESCYMGLYASESSYEKKLNISLSTCTASRMMESLLSRHVSNAKGRQLSTLNCRFLSLQTSNKLW